MFENYFCVNFMILILFHPSNLVYLFPITLNTREYFLIEVYTINKN